MARSFDILTESTASVEQIHAAFSREDYWHARVAGETATLDSLEAGSDGTVSVQVTQHLGQQVLPALIARVIPGDLTLIYRETWRPADAGAIRGRVSVRSSGGLGHSRADNVLSPRGAGAELRSAVRVEVRVPVVGGQIERFLGSSLAGSIPSVLEFTTNWAAANL